jgi:UDP-N-acetylglucosamine 2-epimerase
MACAGGTRVPPLLTSSTEDRQSHSNPGMRRAAMSEPTVFSVVGARPQFVKLGPVSRALRKKGLLELVVHTGQHYDFSMSRSFFEELELPTPDLDLGIASPGPARQLGEMVPALSEALREHRPGLVIVFGDTTSTIAAAIAASYAGIPIAHVEAGMRSFVADMPEEIARVVTDRLSRIWFTASEAADANLVREGLGPGDFVGDTMFDAVTEILPQLDSAGDVETRLELGPKEYALATVHRANNTDDPVRLKGILEALSSFPFPVVFPVHPRTRASIAQHGLQSILDSGRILALEPLRYAETLRLARRARRVFTDSGGLQKEALYLGVPCTTLRDETEWVETVDSGWNVLTGADPERIRSSLDLAPPPGPEPRPYGDGRAGAAIAERVAEWLEVGQR